MSIETTILQAVARAAEQAARAHKRDCMTCGNTVRGAQLPPCPAGKQLRADAAQARRQARESAAADRGPGPDDVPLIGTFDHHLECGHVTPAFHAENAAKCFPV